MLYNVGMEKITTLIIGGGASGLIAATLINNSAGKTLVLERADRVGKKLSATGNGQGNVTNVGVLDAEYFSSTPSGAKRAKTMLARYDHTSFMHYLRSVGLLLTVDDRGRVYPASRQASSVTDALRFTAAQRGVELRLGCKVTAIERTKNGFLVCYSTTDGEKRVFAEQVLLCTGGCVAKQFGTDGTAYALAKSLGHTCTPTYPSLVQLKTDTTHIKTLKGIRVPDAKVRAAWQGGEQTMQGDVIFTDYGVSGDVIFRLSAFFTDKLDGATLAIDFLPEYDEESIYDALLQKQSAYPSLADSELLCGFVNNQIARAIMKRANGNLRVAAALVKTFRLSVKGTTGADMAQVTKGGIPMREVDENLQSRLVDGLYFAGETLDVDGQCGGYNLQWSYTSACVVSSAINAKAGGQV